MESPVAKVAVNRAREMLAIYNREPNAFGISSAIADLLHLATENNVSLPVVLNDAMDFVTYESDDDEWLG